jgi:ribosomal protein S18 acetylase RimI-like enzyme
MPLTLRGLRSDDRPALEAVLRSDGTFRDDEVAVALELIDDALADSGSDYWVQIASDAWEGGESAAEQIMGYACFGPTPMTLSSYDLYWIVTRADARGRGVAGQLIAAMEADLRSRGATGIRIETSELDSYGAARKLYTRHGYREVARIADFYRPGDALVTYYKRL